jgi:ABC-type transport system involved in cytochrome c biogenesis permease component
LAQRPAAGVASAAGDSRLAADGRGDGGRGRLRRAGQTLSVGLQAGLFWVAVLFGMFPALARGFIVEEETGTADCCVWRRAPSASSGQVAVPRDAVRAAECGAGSAVRAAGRAVGWGVGRVAAVVAGGGFCLTTVLTLCGALVAQTAVRGALLAGLTFPLLLPLLLILIAGTRQALEGAFPAEPLQGVFGYALALSAGGAWVFEKVWRE